uniref:Uncharacterized protein n=1 Tax=Molossus molossus TaxID=27622 RepID=A0A7J8I3X1_MOLMO|nr:hypothetical protein HJG59_001941 [Molossus molossus]
MGGGGQGGQVHRRAARGNQRLYQYVLGQDQEVNLTVTHLEVCAPPQPLPLAEGKDRDLWKHEQQVAELGMAEAQKFLEVPVQQSRVLKREELENFINEAIHIQTESLKEVLQCEIQAIYDILDLKLQKKTLNLNAPIPFPLSIAGQSGQDEALKFNKARKEKKAKGKKM